MHAICNSIKQITPGTTALKAGIKHCFILLFAFAFSLQQFSVFACKADAASITSNHHSKPSSWHLFTSSHISFHQFLAPDPLEWEMEFTEEDDGSSRKPSNSTAHKYYLVDNSSFNDLFYISGLQSRFLQFASTVDNRSTIPFFILHHSWKTHLS
ncbi:MAG: hypothetical protein GXC73_14485 [Chitinophagaceae bacterium]|nr:hypothetical protein [Chitinophagaceae bacterium]